MNYQPRTVDLLSILYTIGYFISLNVAFFFPFPDANKDVLNVLLGILSTIMLKIVESYFNKDSSNSATATAIRALSGTEVKPAIVAEDGKVINKIETAVPTQKVDP